MEFNEKLQELRKQKNLTQEELAQELYVSRTAISKWESGRGYPSIDSLKEISKYFQVSIDELLRSEEMITVAEEDNKRKMAYIRDVIYGLLDCSLILFLFLPFFGQKIDGKIYEVSLMAMTEHESYIRITYFTVVIALILCGIISLALQNSNAMWWGKNKYKISLILSAITCIIFIMSLQPYAASFVFLFLVIKVILLIKWG